MYIRQGKLEELDEIYKLYRRNGKYFGWVMKIDVIDCINKKTLLVCIDNDKIIGFCKYLIRKKDLVCVIHEIVVDEQHKGKGIGTQFIDKLPRPIKLKCPVKFESNKFYEHYGFRLVNTYTNKKGTDINEWYLDNIHQKKLF